MDFDTIYQKPLNRVVLKEPHPNNFGKVYYRVS